MTDSTNPPPTVKETMDSRRCPQCGARLTKDGHCSRTVQALSGADAFIDAPIEPEKMLWHLAHGRGPFTTPEDIEIIHWLANREISRREKQDRAEAENAKLRSDFRHPTDSVPLSDLLDAIVRAGEYTGYSQCAQQANPDRGYGASIRKGQRDARAARQSIESFVTALTEENGHLLRALTASNTDYEKLHEQHRALRSSSLTPEEARALLDVLHTLNPQIYGLEQSIDAKLRSLGTLE